jgi:hypothetical protein
VRDSPGLSVFFVSKLFAHKIEFIETPCFAAIDENESQFFTV